MKKTSRTSPLRRLASLVLAAVLLLPSTAHAAAGQQSCRPPSP